VKRHFRSVRLSLPAESLKTLVVILVLARLDYGNAALAGVHQYQFC
jgi:hypothetical protein